MAADSPTSPARKATLASAVRQGNGRSRALVPHSSAGSHRICILLNKLKRVNRLRDALRTQEFCLTADLNLRTPRPARLLVEDAKTLSGSVHAVHVSDVDGFPSLALASLLLENEVDPVVQISAGSKSSTIIETELLGALAAGVTGLLLVRGERDEIKSSEHLSAKEMFHIVRSLREGRPQLDFCAGTPARIFKPRDGWRPRSLIEKVGIGANFVRTQFCFDSAQVRAYVQHLVRGRVTWDASLLLSVAVLPSAKGATWLKANMKGSKVPQAMIHRLEQAQDPEREGVQIAAELIQAFRHIPGVGGVCLMSPGRSELILEAIKASGMGPFGR